MDALAKIGERYNKEVKPKLARIREAISALQRKVDSHNEVRHGLFQKIVASQKAIGTLQEEINVAVMANEEPVGYSTKIHTQQLQVEVFERQINMVDTQIGHCTKEIESKRAELQVVFNTELETLRKSIKLEAMETLCTYFEIVAGWRNYTYGLHDSGLIARNEVHNLWRDEQMLMLSCELVPLMDPSMVNLKYIDMFRNHHRCVQAFA